MVSIDKARSKPRIGVIGVGKMGSYHVRKFAKLLGPENVSYFDPALDESLAWADLKGVEQSTSMDELLFESDAVVIASPTTTHFHNVGRALAAGTHVLVEKPFSGEFEKAQELVRIAEKNNLVLNVGFVERLRIDYLTRIGIHPTNVQYADFQRHATNMNREPGVDVILDLMIHDVDLALSWAGCKPDRIEATGHSVVSEFLDLARCRLHFPNGFEATFFSSRVGKQTLREIIGHTKTGSFVTNLLDESIVAHDPLEHQAEWFLRCIRERDFSNQLSGRSALGVLSTIERIRSSIYERRSTPERVLEFHGV